MTDSTTLPDPNNPVPLKQNINVVALVGAFLVLLVAFGVPLTVDQKTAILGFLALAVPVALAAIHTFWNHPANNVVALKAVRAAEIGIRRSAVILVVMFFALFSLMGCATTGSNVAEQLSIAEAGFSTALTIYNGICQENASANYCTPADLVTAAALEKAITDAISVAQSALSASGGPLSVLGGPDAQADVQKAVDAVTQFNNFVNGLQASKAAKLRLKAGG